MDTAQLLRTVRRIQIRTTKIVNDIMAGQYHSSFKGRGMEFDEVREYQPGDDVRNIDWNVTARLGHPFVKNYREERELTVMLLMDVSRSNDFGTKGRLRKNLATELGAVLAFSAVANNDKVGLVMFSDHIELFVPPKKGKKHVLRIIRELLDFEPKRSGTDISQVLRFMNSVVTRKVICFLVSDFIADGYDMDLKLTAKRHDLVALPITDPVEKVMPNVGLIESEDAETGKRRLIDTSTGWGKRHYEASVKNALEKREELFRSSGVDYIDIMTNEDYMEKLSVFFKKRAKRR